MINHATDEISPAITSSYAVTSVQHQTSVITVTTTVQVSATGVIAPQSPCSCSDQQQISASSSSSDSDVVTVVVPIVVVLGVIIVIVVVIVGILIWRRTRYQSDTPLYDKSVPTKNDFYGLVTLCIDCSSVIGTYVVVHAVFIAHYGKWKIVIMTVKSG